MGIGDTLAICLPQPTKESGELSARAEQTSYFCARGEYPL